MPGSSSSIDWTDGPRLRASGRMRAVHGSNVRLAGPGPVVIVKNNRFTMKGRPDHKNCTGDYPRDMRFLHDQVPLMKKPGMGSGRNSSVSISRLAQNGNIC